MDSKAPRKYIFIYNADSGLANSALNSLHKVISPATYTCSLCELTFGFVNMKKEWKQFLKSSGIEITYIHKNELPEKYKGFNLPIILDEDDKPIFNAIELASLKNLHEFIGQFKQLLD